MMKRFVKVFMVLIMAATVCLPLAACGGGDGEKIDKNRTQLYVNNFKGGYGDEWLYNAKTGFEEKYKDVELETGKKGIQVIISGAKVSGKDIISEVRDGTDEVFFNEYVYYNDFVSQDVMLDISDAVTENLNTTFGENKTIESKLTAEQINYYKVNGKYYGLPHYAGYNGIMYDVDLFEKEGFYLSNNASNGNDGFVLSTTDKKSAGRDGVENTFDDGLPATYTEFFKLLDKISDANVTPIVWTGQYYNDYVENLIQALYADFEGLEQMMLNYNFGDSGVQATNLVKSVAATGTGSNKTATVSYQSPLTITKNNGYELYSQAGRYYALHFVEKILSSTKYYDESVCFNEALSHTSAQNKFLLSTLVNSERNKAMIVEGCWWENEAKDMMRTHAETYGNHAAYGTRRFGLMPLPKADDARANDGYTLYDTHYSLAFIAKRIPEYKKDIALKFLQYVNTDERLADFTVTTNTTKSLQYTLSTEDYNKLTYFGKSVYDMQNASDIVYPYSSNAFYLANQSSFSTHEIFYSKVGGTTYDRPVAAIKKSNVSAENLFNGMKTYYSGTVWNAYLAKV